MSFFDNLFDRLSDGLNNYSTESKAAYEEAKEEMRYKTNAQLWEIMKYMASARAMGRSKAAKEELRRRGLLN